MRHFSTQKQTKNIVLESAEKERNEPEMATPRRTTSKRQDEWWSFVLKETGNEADKMLNWYARGETLLMRMGMHFVFFL